MATIKIPPVLRPSVNGEKQEADVEPRLLQNIALQVVELYPYIEYMRYLLPGSIALAMFVSVMIGGGMLYIDDKARGGFPPGPRRTFRSCAFDT